MTIPHDHARGDDHRSHHDAHAEPAGVLDTLRDPDVQHKLRPIIDDLAEHLDHLGWAVAAIIVNAAMCLFVGAPLLGVLIGLMLGITITYATCVTVMIIWLALAAGLAFVLGRYIPSDAERAEQERARRHTRHLAARDTINAEFAYRYERDRNIAKADGRAAIDAIMRQHHAQRILDARNGDPAAIWALDRAARLEREERERAERHGEDRP